MRDNRVNPKTRYIHASNFFRIYFSTRSLKWVSVNARGRDSLENYVFNIAFQHHSKWEHVSNVHFWMTFNLYGMRIEANPTGQFKMYACKSILACFFYSIFSLSRNCPQFFAATKKIDWSHCRMYGVQIAWLMVNCMHLGSSYHTKNK